MTDFHLDQHYGTAGPLGEFDYVGYYDYATCWNTSNTAKFAFHHLFGILGARFATGLGSAPATRPWPWSPLPQTSWPRTSLLILARSTRSCLCSSTTKLFLILFKTFEASLLSGEVCALDWGRYGALWRRLLVQGHGGRFLFQMIIIKDFGQVVQQGGRDH